MRTVQDGAFTTHDGVELTYRRWPAEKPVRGAIVLFHRGHEHGERMAHLVAELDLPEFDFYAWDARGHGRSPGERGHSPGVADSVRDVQSFVQHISAKDGHAVEDMAVIAQSVGAVMVSAWAHDYAPRIRAMVLAAPAFEVKLYVPGARIGLGMLHALRGDFFVESYVTGRRLTRDPRRAASYDTDPLVAKAISVNLLLGVLETSRRVVEDAAAITVPTQVLISGDDAVVEREPQDRFIENLGATLKERHVMEGFKHDTLGERHRAFALHKARRFILTAFAQPVDRDHLLAADKHGFTRDEADRIAAPLPKRSAANLYWSATRLGLKVAATLSDGIRTGETTGHDSGSTLDYVYRNTPSGRTTLGRAIDKAYLDSIGWKGIRQRKVHVEELLGEAMGLLRGADQPVRIMDIAAGHGRYVLDALAKGEPDSILLRDYSDLNVEGGSRLIAERGLQGRARFVQGDAFDTEDLAAVTPKPTLGIVSGLYELFPENDLVRRSLAGLSRAIAPGGYLVYTGQPWHPQLEFIARALTSHRQGAAWVMRRRTQAEMDELVRAAGFEKLDQRIDRWGIFTVSLARRVDRAAAAPAMIKAA